MSFWVKVNPCHHSLVGKTDINQIITIECKIPIVEDHIGEMWCIRAYSRERWPVQESQEVVMEATGKGGVTEAKRRARNSRQRDLHAPRPWGNWGTGDKYDPKSKNPLSICLILENRSAFSALQMQSESSRNVKENETTPKYPFCNYKLITRAAHLCSTFNFQNTFTFILSLLFPQAKCVVVVAFQRRGRPERPSDCPH